MLDALAGLWVSLRECVWRERDDWLFLGSDNGGRAAATLYSLIQSAKRHGLDPYVRDTLLRVATEPSPNCRELFPDGWIAAHQG